MEKFYVIDYENGKTIYGEFYNYADVLSYAESCSRGYDYTISEYNSEEDYFNNL